MIVSIFNDVIGPVMRGPSSSHCAAALRIGQLARDLTGADFNEVLVEFDRQGSLPTTHDSQGSDMGLFGGLLGWDAADSRLPDSLQALQASGVAIRIETVDAGDPHPNTYRLTLKNQHGERNTLIAISTGGGMIEVIQINGFPVSTFGDYHETLLIVSDKADADRIVAHALALNDVDHALAIEQPDRWMVQIKSGARWSDQALQELTAEFGVLQSHRLAPVLPIPTRKTSHAPFRSCEEMLSHDGDRNTPLWRLALEYECARSGLTEPEVTGKMLDIGRVLRDSIQTGLAGTEYADRVLGRQSNRFDELMREGRLLDGGALNRIVLYVTALMEVKSSMGVIVAAPTAGACAALPGAVIAMAEEMGADENAVARALLAAGVIGVFIATPWTFAAEVGGCQAEGGAAAAMAAAALVTLADGTLQQSVAASSLALQSMLGLICDPVANRVEAPCLGKNVLAASNALSCANMALAGYDPVIPFDEVVGAAKSVAEQMPRELRCTALGGLSITKTSLEIQDRLAAAKAAACGASSCGCGAVQPVALKAPAGQPAEG